LAVHRKQTLLQLKLRPLRRLSALWEFTDTSANVHSGDGAGRGTVGGPDAVAVSSNLHPAAFDELMPKTLATATVDRLLHHAHVCQTTGDSVRLCQALTGQGVKPLT
jgi:hypothetical protein